MTGAAIECDLLDTSMRPIEDGAARSLVQAGRLDADEAVLDQIKPADAVGAAKVIERSEQLRRRERPAVERGRIATLEADRDDGRLVWRALGIDRARIDVVRDL